MRSKGREQQNFVFCSFGATFRSSRYKKQLLTFFWATFKQIFEKLQATFWEISSNLWKALHVSNLVFSSNGLIDVGQLFVVDPTSCIRERCLRNSYYYLVHQRGLGVWWSCDWPTPGSFPALSTGEWPANVVVQTSGFSPISISCLSRFSSCTWKADHNG